MSRKFGEIAFTPFVIAAQEQRGSRKTYENISPMDQLTI